MNTDVPLSQVPQVQAVVFIGADAVSMMVAESSEAGVRVLDVLSQPVELAKDVFSGGIIRRETMDRCVHIINGYETLLKEYGENITPRLLGSNVLMSIRFMDAVMNRLLNSWMTVK